MARRPPTQNRKKGLGFPLEHTAKETKKLATSDPSQEDRRRQSRELPASWIKKMRDMRESKPLFTNKAPKRERELAVRQLLGSRVIGWACTLAFSCRRVT